ncbi:hypothetical protein NL676_001234 [Syzygium grande]|nr:hypothetical protein NL676_001234 [Syzygium grande]
MLGEIPARKGHGKSICFGAGVCLLDKGKRARHLPHLQIGFYPNWDRWSGSSTIRALLMARFVSSRNYRAIRLDAHFSQPFAGVLNEKSDPNPHLLPPERARNGGASKNGVAGIIARRPVPEGHERRLMWRRNGYSSGRGGGPSEIGPYVGEARRCRLRRFIAAAVVATEPSQ